MPPRSYTEAMDRPTVLYILYTMMSAQQTNLLPKTASRNDPIFAQKVYRIYATISQYLSSYGCAITMVYIYIYIYIGPTIHPTNLTLTQVAVIAASCCVSHICMVGGGGGCSCMLIYIYSASCNLHH